MGSFNAMRHQILSMVCLEKPSREYLDLSFMYGIRGGGVRSKSVADKPQGCADASHARLNGPGLSYVMPRFSQGQRSTPSTQALKPAEEKISKPTV